MDEIRVTALAYYESLPESQKQKAGDLFRSMDMDGDGKIDLQEYIVALNQLGITCITDIGFFKELDGDGNGSLDFYEVITLFYIIKSGRLVFCDGCRVFLKGVYFTCDDCFTCGKSFDLCCSCYRNKNFHHHADATFFDNYTLLRRKGLQQASSSPTQSSHRQSFEEIVASSSPTQSSHRQSFEEIVSLVWEKEKQKQQASSSPTQSSHRQSFKEIVASSSPTQSSHRQSFEKIVENTVETVETLSSIYEFLEVLSNIL